MESHQWINLRRFSEEGSASTLGLSEGKGLSSEDKEKRDRESPDFIRGESILSLRKLKEMHLNFNS
jgi:hypothetical protein